MGSSGVKKHVQLLQGTTDGQKKTNPGMVGSRNGGPKFPPVLR
jgi:hypothetical protein